MWFRKSKSEPAKVKTFPLGFKVTYESSDRPEIDIVAVHGFSADRDRTWGRHGIDWLTDSKMLPNDMKSARIMAFGYNSSWFGKSSIATELPGVSKQLLELVQNNREKCLRRPVILIGHCLGGILIEKALVEAHFRRNEYDKALLSSISGIALFGTPHKGTESAEYAVTVAQVLGKFDIASNSDMLQALRQSSQLLKDTVRQFAEQAKDYQLNVVCFYEQKDTDIYLPARKFLPFLPRKKKRMVDLSSACLDGHARLPLEKDHFSLNKFDGPVDANYILVRRKLIEFMEKGPRPANLSQNYQQHVIIPFSRDKDFIQRLDCLGQDAIEVLKAWRPYRDAHTRSAIWGLGGIGKTQVAIELCYQLAEQDPSLSVFWVSARNAAAFRKDFQVIAERLKLPGWDDPKENVLELVERWLSNPENGRWLLNLDNMDNLDQLDEAPAASGEDEDLGPKSLCRYIPQVPGGYVTITTRDKRVAFDMGDPSRMVTLGPMMQKEAVMLLKSKLPDSKASQESLEKLVAMVDFVPLAIVQAAAFIRFSETDTSVDDYLTLYKEEKELARLLKVPFADRRRGETSRLSVAATWQISFKQIQKKTPIAADVLSLMAVLDRQNIPESMFQIHWSSSDLDLAIDTLLGYSLIVREILSHSFSMHRLVQAAIQGWLENENKLEKVQTKSIYQVAISFPPAEHDDWKPCVAYLPHASAVLKYRSQGDAEGVGRALLLQKMAWFALLQGRYNDADELAQEVCLIRHSYYGDEHETTLACDCLKGLIFYMQGNLQAAEKQLTPTSELCKRVFGLEHSITLICMSTLASCYRDSGRLEEAEKLEVQVLETSTAVYGSEHPETITSMSNLAMCYRKMGRLEDAIKLKSDVVDVSVRILGAEHPDTLVRKDHMATLYLDQGHLDAAEELELEIIEISNRVLGDMHPETISSVSQLATIRQRKGKLEEAEQLHLEAFDKRQRTVGIKHSGTLRSMHNLALLYKEQGRIDEAITILTSCLNTTEELLGPSNPNTINRRLLLEELRSSKSGGSELK